MDIEALSGRDLDKYGESIGIPRYQGLGLPEDDDTYRKTLRKSIVTSITSSAGSSCTNVSGGSQIFHISKADPLYGVLYIEDGKVIRVCCEYSSSVLAIYSSRSEAQITADTWTNKSNLPDNGKYEVREVKLFG